MLELPLRGVRAGLDKRKSPAKSGFGMEEKGVHVTRQDHALQALSQIGFGDVAGGGEELRAARRFRVVSNERG